MPIRGGMRVRSPRAAAGAAHVLLRELAPVEAHARLYPSAARAVAATGAADGPAPAPAGKRWRGPWWCA